MWCWCSDGACGCYHVHNKGKDLYAMFAGRLVCVGPLMVNVWSTYGQRTCAKHDRATSSGCRTTCTRHALGIMVAMLPRCQALASILSTTRDGDAPSGAAARSEVTYSATMVSTASLSAGSCVATVRPLLGSSLTVHQCTQIAFEHMTVVRGWWCCRVVHTSTQVARSIVSQTLPHKLCHISCYKGCYNKGTCVAAYSMSWIKID